MTTSLNVNSTYSDTLSRNSPTFVRPNGDSGSYYFYQAILVFTFTAATYTLESTSSIDTYGCLYALSFDPLYPYDNLIACDDDSGGDQQFLINNYLQSRGIYILVVTTYGDAIVGSYLITAIGPASVYMSPITPSTYPTTSVPTTIYPTTTEFRKYFYFIQNSIEIINISCIRWNEYFSKKIRTVFELVLISIC